jgi:hypothetical protein
LDYWIKIILGLLDFDRVYALNNNSSRPKSQNIRSPTFFLNRPKPLKIRKPNSIPNQCTKA